MALTNTEQQLNKDSINYNSLNQGLDSTSITASPFGEIQKIKSPALVVDPSAQKVIRGNEAGDFITGTCFTLWVGDDSYLIATQRLHPFFHVRAYKEVVGSCVTGENYIIQGSDITEATIKALAWKIQSTGGECKIYRSQLPLLSLMGDSLSIKELTGQILDFSTSYQDWAIRIDQEKLSTKQAAEIAKVAIALLPESQKLVELATLRARCYESPSSWEWTKIVQTLEEEFRQELHKRLQNNSQDRETLVIELGLRDRVVQILTSLHSASERKEALRQLADSLNTRNITLAYLEKYALLIEEELVASETKGERASEIDNLLKLTQAALNLFDFLPTELAQPLNQWCNWLNIRPEVALTAVLTATSSLHKVGTELVIHRGQDFRVPPVIYAALVGESGQRKSPVFRTLMRKPLGKLQLEAKKRYAMDLENYAKAMAAWNPSSGEPKPIEPHQEIFYFMDGTGEGIKQQAAKRPDKSLLALIDELAGLLNSSDKYRSGRGSDKQDLLSYFDGLGQTVLRATGITADVDKVYLSIFGTIQPQILKQYTKDLSDPDGHWARFLCVTQPLVAATLCDDNSNIDITQMLTNYYSRVTMLPQQEYKLSHQAFKRYQQIYNHLEKLRVSHPQAGMRAVYSKMEGYIGRIALNLHVLEAAVNNIFPSQEISLTTLDKAIALAKFYLGQIKLIHADTAADNGELSAVLAKLLSVAHKKGKLSARDANRACFNSRGKTNEIIKYFQELEDLNYGVVENKGTSWIFIPKIADCQQCQPSVSNTVSNNRETKTLVNSRFEEFSNQSVSSVSSVSNFVESLTEQITNQQLNNDQQTEKALGTNTELVMPVSQYQSECQQPLDSFTDNADTADTEAVVPGSQCKSECQQPLDSFTDNADNANEPNLKVGDHVTLADPFQVRHGFLGIVEEILSNGEFLIQWLTDDSHQSYSAHDLKLFPVKEEHE